MINGTEGNAPITLGDAITFQSADGSVNVAVSQGSAIVDLSAEGIIGPTGPQGLQGLIGPQGLQGLIGPQGLQGSTGPQGLQGEIGPAGPAGSQGTQGNTGPIGPAGATGADGRSAYQVAVDEEFEGTEEEWLASLVGPAGATGADGRSAYQVAVDEEFEGTEEEWLASLVGPTGPAGPTGVTGPANGLNAFGGIYNNAEISNTIAEDVPFVVAMPRALDSKNIATNDGRITIEEAGIYYIAYSMYPSFSAAATLKLEVRSNGTVIVPTASTVAGTSTNYSVSYSGNTIAALPENAVIDMAVTSSVGQTMTFDENTVEILTVLKLN